MSMNQEAQDKLSEILAKDISAITEEDAQFLRARADYLDESQKAEYAEFLNPSEAGSGSGEGEVVLEELGFSGLKDIAREMGIENVDDRKLFKSKQSLIDAIVAKQAELEAAKAEEAGSGESSDQE